MAAHIVDVLKAVEIDEQHSSVQPTSLRTGDRLAQPVGKETAISQTCQAVMQSQVDYLRVRALALSYVGVGPHNAASSQGVSADFENAAIGADLLPGPINIGIVPAQR